MALQTLFKKYKEVIDINPEITRIFEESGMVNERGTLDFGFFPLGSGVLSKEREKSKIEKAKMPAGGVMVLGNDFGTLKGVRNLIENNNRGEERSTTVVNLQKLSLDLETTFFTNYYLGLRDDDERKGDKYKKVTSTIRGLSLQEEYKKLCAKFFVHQLDIGNPRTVLCLGNEVGHALFKQDEILFKNFSSKGGIMKKFDAVNDDLFIVNTTENSVFGQRKFILIPHPAYAGRYWKGDVKERIIAALKS